MILKYVLLALALGYIICVVAKKQEKILKTLGYTIGVAIIVFGLIYGLLISTTCSPMMGKMGGMCGKGKMMKCCPGKMMKM